MGVAFGLGVKKDVLLGVFVGRRFIQWKTISCYSDIYRTQKDDHSISSVIERKYDP